MLDVTELAAPKTDQLNADHLIPGPLQGVIVSVRKTRANDKDCIEVGLSSFRLPWRPCKTMVRLLMDVWGPDAEAWIGRGVKLYRDAEVRFGTDTVGGIRIGGLSHVRGSFTAKVKTSKQNQKPYQIEKLPDPPPIGQPAADPLADLATAHSVDVAALEAAIVSQTGRPIRDRAKAAIWAAEPAKLAELLAAITAATAAP